MKCVGKVLSFVSLVSLLLGFHFKVPSALFSVSFPWISTDRNLILWLIYLPQKSRGSEWKLWVARQLAAPLGSAQSAWKWSAMYSLRARRTHTLSLPRWNKTILQFDPANLSAYLLFQLLSHSLLFTGGLSSPWQSRSIHYVLPLFNLLGKFNFQMNTMPC